MFLELQSIYGQPVFINVKHIVSINNMPEAKAEGLSDKPQLEYTNVRTTVGEYRVFETAEYIMERIECAKPKE